MQFSLLSHFLNWHEIFYRIIAPNLLAKISVNFTHYFSGFTIEFGAAVTALLASKVGLPISTTHSLVNFCVDYLFIESPIKIALQRKC